MGLGHSGTNAAWRIFRQLEVVTDDHSEWGPVVVVNGEIIKHYFGGDHPWWSMPRHSGPLPGELVRQVRTVRLLRVVKDPRWSITLPHWLEHAPDRVPQHVILLDRDAVGCALSWTHDHVNNGHPKMFPAAITAVEYRKEVLSACERTLVEMGRTVYRFTYPQFLLEPEGLIDVIAKIAGLSKERVAEVVAEHVKPERIHSYEFVGGKSVKSGLPQPGCPQGDAR